MVTTTKKLDREANASYLLTVRYELYQVLVLRVTFSLSTGQTNLIIVSMRVETFSVRYSDSNNFNFSLLLLHIFMCS